MQHLSHSTRLCPSLASEFWLIGKSPYFEELHSTLPALQPECVDHHLYRSTDGAWHLWGCIRGLTTGRILYHWEGERLDRGPWQQTGESIRPDHEAGESLHEWDGQEWIQSPFVVKDISHFHFFFGGHSTGLDRHGHEITPDDPHVECQICLMTSADGRNWKRHRNALGQSRLFTGPGEARDPCIIRIGETWHMYYTGYESGHPLQPGIYLRTSLDLIRWSDPRLVHRDYRFGNGRWTHECPQVVERGDTFYLFRTEDYDRARTHCYWSTDPTDFGIGQTASKKYIGILPLAAPEVIVDENGSEYITSCHDLLMGIKICRLSWVSSP